MGCDHTGPALGSFDVRVNVSDLVASIHFSFVICVLQYFDSPPSLDFGVNGQTGETSHPNFDYVRIQKRLPHLFLCASSLLVPSSQKFNKFFCDCIF
jgi:hypothetical protein